MAGGRTAGFLDSVRAQSEALRAEARELGAALGAAPWAAAQLYGHVDGDGARASVACAARLALLAPPPKPSVLRCGAGGGAAEAIVGRASAPAPRAHAGGHASDSRCTDGSVGPRARGAAGEARGRLSDGARASHAHGAPGGDPAECAAGNDGSPASADGDGAGARERLVALALERMGTRGIALALAAPSGGCAPPDAPDARAGQRPLSARLRETVSYTHLTLPTKRIV